MDKLYCVKCGKENGVEGGRFCAFCGGELAERAASPTKEAERLCIGLKNTYINYINWSSDYMARRSAGKILAGMFTGNGDYNNRDEHKVFAADCEKAAGEICRAMEQGGDSAAVKQLLDYVLFEVYDHCGDEAGWMILACEKYYIPFLEHLSRDELAELSPRYRQFRKKKMNLPVQDDMQKKMKALLK